MSTPHYDPNESRPRLDYQPRAQRAVINPLPSANIAGWLVAAVIFINEASFRLPDPDNFSLDWQILLRLAVCGCCGLYALKYWPTAWTLLDRFPSALILLFGAWGACTVPFAVNVPYAAASCLSTWCIILFTPVALMHLGPKRFLMSAFASFALFAVGSWFVYYAIPSLGRTEFVMPDLEVRYRFGGLTHSTNLGRHMALMLIVGMTLGYEKFVPWRKLTAGLILALVTLCITDSRTSMVAAAIAGVQLYTLRGARERRLVLEFLGVGIVGAAAFALAGISQSGSNEFDPLRALSRSGEATEIYNLTGRTEIWRFALEHVAESPIVGCGFGCSRFVMCRFEAISLNQAHNLAINVMLNVGIPGVVLLIMSCVMQLRAAVFRPCAFPDMMIVLILVFGLTDTPLYPAIADGATMLWFSSIVWRPVCEQLAFQTSEAVG